MPNDADSLTESDEDAPFDGLDAGSSEAPAEAPADDRDDVDDRDVDDRDVDDRDVDDRDVHVDEGLAGGGRSEGDGGATAAHRTIDADGDEPEVEELVTLEDLGAADADFVTVEDLDGEPIEVEGAGSELLFDGDPEEFELDFGPGPYPDSRPVPGDLLVFDEPTGPAGPPLRRMSRMERRRRVRLQARRVRRIVRHIEPWSVLKISIFFYACLWVIFLVAGFMIWGVAESSGTVDKLENLIRELFALETFDFDAGQIFRGYALGGLALAIAGTTFNVLMCLLFNLISDLTGGLRITMIEEETARPAPARRRRRRPPSRR